MTYTMAVENGSDTFDELFPLYSMHYAEMTGNLAKQGIDAAPFDARWDQYRAAWDGGWLLNYVVRRNDKAVGYANIYLTHDMHSREPIAQEDAIFLHPDHRNGMGRKLCKFILSDLKERGTVRLIVMSGTDPRAGLLYERLGAVPTAKVYTYTF